MARTSTRGTDTPRTTKGIARDQQIISIAESLFYKQGYAKTSVGDIAEAAGLLKASLYYYMDSKEDLLYRIVDEVHKVSHEKLTAALADEGRRALDRLVDLVRTQLLYNTESHTRVAVYLHEWDRLEGKKFEEVRERRKHYFTDLDALIEQARDEGDLPADIDVPLVANTLLAVVCWPYTWYRPGSIEPGRLADFGAEFARGALVGLRPIED